ncbi:MAG: penicillin-binding protein activator [Hyphomicrobiaceae bacterium]|nr:penicillin-binding protein activator [Hyphomicrobiaceae bacterium]
MTRRTTPNSQYPLSRQTSRDLRGRAGQSAMALVALAGVAAAGLLAGGCAPSLGSVAPGLPGAIAGDSAPGHAQAAPSSRRQQHRAVKIAMLLPLAGMGQTAIIAKSMKQAGELALFDIDNPAIQLVVKDAGQTPQASAAAAQQAVSEGAEIIVGPVFANAVAAAAVPARQARVPIIAFSNDRNVAGNGVYLMSYLPDAEVERIVSYAVARGKRRFAALVPQDGYGREVDRAFRAAVQKSGGEIVAIESYEPGANAMLEPAQRIFETIKETSSLGSPIDALFLPGGQDALSSLAPMIAYAGIDTRQVQLLGTGAWDFPNVGRDDVLVGGWYPSPDPDGFKAFSERFAQTFGQAPPRIASLAYDAVALAIQAGGGRRDNEDVHGALVAAAAFKGVDGPVRLESSGLNKRSLAVLEVQKFGVAVIDAADGSGPKPGAAPAGGPPTDGARGDGSAAALRQPHEGVATPRPVF